MLIIGEPAYRWQRLARHKKRCPLLIVVLIIRLPNRSSTLRAPIRRGAEIITAIRTMARRKWLCFYRRHQPVKEPNQRQNREDRRPGSMHPDEPDGSGIDFKGAELETHVSALNLRREDVGD